MVSSDFGKLDVNRHFNSGIDCATAGAATADAASPAPLALRNSRRFIRLPLHGPPRPNNVSRSVIGRTARGYGRAPHRNPAARTPKTKVAGAGRQAPGGRTAVIRPCYVTGLPER